MKKEAANMGTQSLHLCQYCKTTGLNLQRPVTDRKSEKRKNKKVFNLSPILL